MKRKIGAFVSFAQAYSLPLIVGIIVALIWANISYDSYRIFVESHWFGSDHISLHFLIKEIFMALFFAIAMVEIVEAVSPGGAMYPIKKAFNPLMATAGGVLGPIIVYVLLVVLLDGMEYMNGWGIVTATDIAIAWLGAKLIFGPNHPAVKYLLLLAIADDAIGLIIIGVFYPSAPIELSYLLLCLLGMAVAGVLRAMHVQHYGFYIILGGIPSWIGLFNAHIEPALALVFIIPFLPSNHRRARMEKDGVVPRHPDRMALEDFYWHWKPVVDWGLFFFGLVSAGVLFSSIGKVTVFVTVALIVGKTIGISCMGMFADKIGFSLPSCMTKRELIVMSVIAGAGLTVSLFICDAAFTDPVTVAAAKMGALFSIFAIPLGMVSAKVLKTRSFKTKLTREENIACEQKAQGK
ncbi:MAG: Na+/H+ antiporter NhaA [Firmicutes bacterium]|nr:Na+/H+ antiporter NhaA [Bacillota bacterium]